MKISFFRLAGIVLAIVLLGMTAMYLLVDPNRLKPRIISLIQQKTGYVATLNGSLSWSFYPLFSIYINELALTEANHHQPFLTLERASLSLPWNVWFKQEPIWQGAIKVDLVRFNHRIEVNNLNTQLIWKNHALTLDQLSGDFYQGKLRGSIHYDKESPFTWRWQLESVETKLELLLQALSDQTHSSVLTGKANLHFTGEVPSTKQQPFLKQLTGTMQFNIQPGALEGVDLNYFIDTGLALLLRHPTSNQQPMLNTPFDQLTGSITFLDGIAKTHDIAIQTQRFTAHAEGEIDFIQKTLNFALKVSPKKETHWHIPILMTGQWKKPKIALDTLSIQTLMTKEELQKVKIKVKKELKKLPHRANKLLTRLLGLHSQDGKLIDDHHFSHHHA